MVDNEFDEWKSLFSEDIEIRVNVKKINNILIPCLVGPYFVDFKFKKMTCKDHWNIEKICTRTAYDETKECEGGFPLKIDYVDYQEFKKEIICRMIKSISFYRLKFKKNGELTEKSKDYVLSLPAPLIQSVIEKYEKSVRLSEEEEETIIKQSIILFGKNSKGVENACEAVNLYCNIGNFWEKFGLNRFQIKDLPYKEYVMLKMMISKENQSIASKNSASANKGKNNNIMMNGKMRKSSGISVPDTGQIF